MNGMGVPNVDEPDGHDEQLGTFPYLAASEARLLPLTIDRVGKLELEPGFRLHRTDEGMFLVEYVTEGDFRMRVGGIDETMTAGQFAVIDCHVPHVFTSAAGCRHIYVYYDGPAARPYYDYVMAHGGSPVVTPGEPAAAVHEISFLYNAVRRHQDIGEAHLAHHLDALLTELAAGAAGAGADAHRRSPVVRARMMIAERYAEPLTLERLAAAVCMSPFHFAKLFKEETGVTPHRYLIDMRIRQAKFYLCYTSASVASVAADCGFGSPSAFSTAFRRETGLGPQAYRDAVRG